MCRMVGVVYRGEFPLDVLHDLREISEDGKVPEPGAEGHGHKHGWGIVGLKSGEPFFIGRSTKEAHLDGAYDAALSGVMNLEAPNIVIGHVRHASAGSISMENTHPFIVDGMALGHNGTVYGLNPVTRHKSIGTTDSERLAMLVADRRQEMGDLQLAIEFVLKEDLRDLSFSALILMATDGRRLHVYRDFADDNKAWYYDLRMARSDNSVFFFQEARRQYDARMSQVSKQELVTVDMELNVTRRKIG